MKIKSASLFLAAAVLLSAACSKKSSSSLPPQNVIGYWVGEFGDGTQYPTVTFNFLFRSNGTVRVYEDSDTTQYASEGTYAVYGATVTTTYNYLGTTTQFSTQATIDGQYTFMQGVWGDAGNPTASNGGSFYLVRQLQ